MVQILASRCQIDVLQDWNVNQLLYELKKGLDFILPLIILDNGLNLKQKLAELACSPDPMINVNSDYLLVLVPLDSHFMRLDL